MTGINALRPLRCLINQQAHAKALQYEAHLRDSWLAQLQAARESGASFGELAELVDRLENQPAQALTR
jgi:hypothetical protein